MKPRMINTSCHGCKLPMSFEAVPVKIVEMTGKVTEHYGKDSAAWICGTCRLDKDKLKAARLAAGLPASPTMPVGFEEDEVVYG